MCSDSSLRTFQFHKGTIKTNLEMLNISNDSNFNSIKVQLKHLIKLRSLAAKSFQFHKGTIKTQILLLALITRTYFNSIKVQLKHLYQRVQR